MGRMEEKECPKKGVLGRDIKSSSTGVIPPRSIPVRKGSLPLFLSFSFSRSLTSLPPSLCSCSSSFRPLPCLAKTRCLSLKVTRRNRRRVTRACKRVEERERKGLKGKGGGSPLVGGGPREPRGRRYTHSSLYYGYRRKSPKGKYVKQRPLPHIACCSSYLSHSPLSPHIYECV